MSVLGLEPVVIKQWGGLSNTDDPLSLSPGLSPDCADVEFYPGGVRTRPGLSVLASTGYSYNPVYIKPYVKSDNTTRRLLVFDGGGQFFQESTPGTLTRIGAGYHEATYAQSATLFGREFIALSDGKRGVLPPLQFDGTNLDRLSQGGPGAAPTPTENAAAGSISVGVHKVVCLFVTRSGYITAPSPVDQWTASGLSTVDIASIPTGPPNVIQRILAFTQSNDTSYFWIPGGKMVVNDNTTTSVTGIDFADAPLSAGESVDPYLFLTPLPDCAGLVVHQDRLMAWGVKNVVPRVGDRGPLNMGFDGGFDPATGVPLGWGLNRGAVRKANSGELTGLPTPGIAFGAYGDALVFLGDGVTANGPEIENQGGTADTYLLPAIAYRARIRIKQNGSLTSGGIAMFTVISGSPATGLVIPHGSITTEWQVFEGVFLAPTSPMPTGAVHVRIAGSGTQNGGSLIFIDYAEIVPDAQPDAGSTVYVANPDDAESFDGVTGFINVAENDGQRIGCCFRMRNITYVEKEESLFAVRDSDDVPTNWNVDPISQMAGTPSVHGIGSGEDWAVMACRNGFYLFDGGTFQDLAHEIQTTWKRINWAYGETIWVTVDALINRIYIGVPLDSATSPSHMLVYDYTSGFGAAGKSFTSFSGTAGGRWAVWNIASKAAMVCKRPTTLGWDLLLGTTNSSGRIAKLDTAATDDLGAFINSYYETTLYAEDSGNSLFGYLTMLISGSGKLRVTAYREDGTTSYAVGGSAGFVLHEPVDRDTESTMNIIAERLRFKLSLDATVGSRFSMRTFVPWIRKQAAGWPVSGSRA